MSDEDKLDFENLCGACQRWGYSPRIESGNCIECGRSEEQIISTHGKCFLTCDEQRKIKEINYGPRRCTDETTEYKDD